MLKALAAVVFVVLLLGTRPVSATESSVCYPYCDFNHYYGPYDFTYYGPKSTALGQLGWFGFPRCGPSGECSPYLVYSYSGPRRGRVTVRPSRTRAIRPLQ